MQKSHDNLIDLILNDVDTNDIVKAAITHYLHNTVDSSFSYKNSSVKAIKKYAEKTSYGETLSDKQVEQMLNDYAFHQKQNFPPPDKPKYKFIDLFAGIGGFRLANQNLGGKCVYSSEWDKYSQVLILAALRETNSEKYTKKVIAYFLI